VKSGNRLMRIAPRKGCGILVMRTWTTLGPKRDVDSSPNEESVVGLWPVGDEQEQLSELKADLIGTLGLTFQ
jgi:hypothetical protein